MARMTGSTTSTPKNSPPKRMQSETVSGSVFFMWLQWLHVVTYGYKPERGIKRCLIL